MKMETHKTYGMLQKKFLEGKFMMINVHIKKKDLK